MRVANGVARRNVIAMPSLEFNVSSIDRRFSLDGEGAAFQSFVFELLDREMPHLHPYPAGGKDGGIDHMTDEPGSPRTVVECKFCGKDGIDEVRRRWAETAKNLKKNLEPANMPNQGQYRPWYRTDESIRHYIFTTSARLENAARVDELRDEIRDFFHGLARDRAHLHHLSNLTVEVRDWNYLEASVSARLRFRWFPRQRPTGLKLLEAEVKTPDAFRAWLRSAKLPFYSRAQHLAKEPAPAGAGIPDERALLASLGGDADVLGLIVAGPGGVGKTRLALEIGNLAVVDGWSVWFVGGRLETAAIDELAARMTEGSRSLLIFDYVETHAEFAGVVQRIADVVDDTDHVLRYIATCRSTYYGTLRGLERKRAVQLSRGESLSERWMEGYRQATVQHILADAGLDADERSLKTCHDLPVLAAFQHWMQRRGRSEDLNALLEEEGFGNWVLSRVSFSFPGRDMGHSFARLLALFPFSAVGRELLREDERELFYKLEADGWIERAEDPTAGEAAWQTAHDVLADQVAVAWLDTYGSAAYEWCAELLRESLRLGALPSALRSLQRLSDQLPLGEADWERLFARESARAPEVWESIRSSLLRTSLLTVRARVRLLASLVELFSGAETDPDFQGALGDLLRQLLDSEDANGLVEEERALLIAWVRRAIPHQQGLPVLRAWSLRFAPEAFRAQAQGYLEKRSDALSSQYVLCAWLYAGLGPRPIRASAEAWCRTHATTPQFSFVAEAWIGAGGEGGFLQPFLGRWFERFLTTDKPSFVIAAWLKKGHSPTDIRGAALAWLGAHGASPEARFVLAPWLEFGGDPAAVREVALAWLGAHGASPEAGFVLNAWLAHAGDPAAVREVALAWLGAHGASPEARFVLAPWLEFGGDPAAVREVALAWLGAHGASPEAGFVLNAWLAHAGDPAAVREVALAWLGAHGASPEARFVLAPWLEFGGDPAAVREVALAWLGAHGASPEAGFVLNAWLAHAGDPAAVREVALAWLGAHGASPEAGFVLNAWLAHAGDPAAVREVALAWLGAHGASPEAGFVLNAWLAHAGDPAAVREVALAWLGAHGASPEAGFVLSRWLEFSLEPESVDAIVEDWLKLYATYSEEASHVLRTWLRSKVDGKLALPYVETWLSTNGNELNAQYVLAAWMKAGNPAEAISESVSLWLTQYDLESEASHVIGPWLSAGGSYEAIQHSIIRWLDKHGGRFEAGFVLAPSLDAPSARARMAPYALRWLEDHAERHEAGFVLEASFDGPLNLADLTPSFLRWLSRHGDKIAASKVMSRWLRSGGRPEDIGTHVVGWLERWLARANASWILVTWLESGGAPAVIERFVGEFVQLEKSPKAIRLVKKVWDRTTGPTPETKF